MKVDRALISRVAEVARLSLTPAEAKELIPQLEEILRAFSKIDTADTKGVKPSFHPVELKSLLRDDKKHRCLSQDEALSNTSHKKDGYFKGPRAI